MTEQELRQRFLDQIEGRAKRSYSEGRMGPRDEGDLAVLLILDRERKRIVMDFGKQITWTALSAEDATAIAERLVVMARQLSTTTEGTE